jgi:hypothetical protein
MTASATRRPVLRRAAAAVVAAGSLAFLGTGLATGASAAPAAQAQAPSTASAESQVQQVLAHYVRDTDHRDGAALSALFTTNGSVKISAKDDKGAYTAVGTLTGRDAISYAVTHLQAPLGELASEQHSITAPVTDVKGNKAHLNVQFITFAIQGTKEPVGGWPAGTAGVQGTVKPYESGYYDADMTKVHGSWKITQLRILGDLPMVLPGA